MSTTTILKLATASVAFTISAHAVEVFRVTTVAKTYPVALATDFNAVDADGNFTNPFNIYGTTDIGNGSGMTVTSNFDGANSAINTGDQKTTGINTSTYFGPKFYTGINREAWQTQGGVMHSDGNGYRIRANSVTVEQIGTAHIGTAHIGTAQVGVPGDVDYVPASADYAPASADYAPATGNGGNPFNTKAIFMFDADTSSLSGADDNYIFSDTDTLTAKLSVPPTMGPNSAISPNRVSLASYRAMVKAKGPNDVTAQYYAGSLYTIDLAALPDSSTVFNMSETGAAATWTLMPNIESSDNSFGVTNLTVDTSVSSTTVLGKFLTNITQVGFLLETDTNENTGGYNYGVREFIANASPASAPHPIEWSQDFTSPVNGTGTFLTYDSYKLYDGAVDPANLLTGFDHAYKWVMNGGGLTAIPFASTVLQDNNQIVLDVNSRGPDGEVNVRMVGPGTDNARRVRPPPHETTFEIDLIEWKNGQADLLLQTRGHDGYIRSVISPSGNVKYSTWGSDYNHTNFDNFPGPSSFRNNSNNPGIVIIDGGTFDPTNVDPVTITISGNAEGTVTMNAMDDAVESVTLVNYGSGYTVEPTVTFAGGGMTVAPTISFNFSTGNTSRPNVVQTNLRDTDGDGMNDLPGSLLNDGQILTYIQSYDSSDDSISFYYSLTDKGNGVVTGPTFITTLTAADHSPGGYGFFDVSTGNKWGQPNNQDAVWIQYKQWGTSGYAARLGINSVTVALSDDDRDGIPNRNDAFPDDPNDNADSDSDGVGDSSDQHPGYNDSAVAAIDAAVQTAGSDTFSYYVITNADDHSYSTGGGDITQEAYDLVVSARDAALQDKQTAENALADASSESRTLGQHDVTSNPSDYGLFTSSDLSDAQSSSRSEGQQDVISSPSDYDLMSAVGVFDMRISQPGISTNGDKASMNFTIQSSDDLEEWNNEETIQRDYTMPSDKNFMRVSVGIELEVEPSLTTIATDIFGDKLVYDEFNNLYVNDKNTPLKRNGIKIKTNTYSGWNFYAVEPIGDRYFCILKNGNQNVIMFFELDGSYWSNFYDITDLSVYENDFGQSL